MKEADRESRGTKKFMLDNLKKNVFLEKENISEYRGNENLQKIKEIETSSKEKYLNNYYEEKIKILEEKIRKCEIEKAELDLKISQYESKGRKCTDDSSNSVTKLLYIENRELKRNLKLLNQEIVQVKRVNIHASDNKEKIIVKNINEKNKTSKEIKSTQVTNKTTNTSQLINENAINNEMLLKLKEMKQICKRQKIKHKKKIAVLQIGKTLNAPIIKAFRRVYELLNFNKTITIAKNPSKTITKLSKLLFAREKILTLEVKKKFYFQKFRAQILYQKSILNKLSNHIIKVLQKPLNLWKKYSITKKEKKIINLKRNSLIIFENIQKSKKFKIFSCLKEIYVDGINKIKALQEEKIKNQLKENQEKIFFLSGYLNNALHNLFLSKLQKSLSIKSSNVLKTILTYSKNQQNLYMILKRFLNKRKKWINYVVFNT